MREERHSGPERNMILSMLFASKVSPFFSLQSLNCTYRCSFYYNLESNYELRLSGNFVSYYYYLNFLTMRTLKYSVGIDIAKSTFQACLSSINDLQEVKVKSSSSFSNNHKGFEAMIAWVSRHEKEKLPTCFLMEATGIYYEQIAWFLHKNGYLVSVIIPSKAKRIMQALGIRSKNDKIDAQGLSFMNAQQSLPL